jgi:hypothetical protein
MAKYSKESLEKLLVLIDEIGKEDENLWFKMEIVNKYSKNVSKMSELDELHKDLRRTKSFLKYIDGQYWREGFNFYKKISDSSLKIMLISDFKEMKISDHDNNILEFVRRLILQLENILNHLISKFDAYNVIKDNPNQFKGEKFNLVEGTYSFFQENGDQKPLKNISLPSKLTWAKIYFNFNYSFNIWRDLTFVRNKASHRENLKAEDQLKMEEIESNWESNKIEYNKFFNSLSKQLTNHI